jgi:hypothetical protein
MDKGKFSFFLPHVRTLRERERERERRSLRGRARRGGFEGKSFHPSFSFFSYAMLKFLDILLRCLKDISLLIFMVMVMLLLIWYCVIDEGMIFGCGVIQNG